MFFRKKKPQYYKMHFIFRDCNNLPITEVWTDGDGKVKYKNYTDKLLFTCFGHNTSPNYEDVIRFLESRCFPRNRSDIKQILRQLHLKEYDPYLMCKLSNGQTEQDDCCIDFLEE